MALNVFGLMGYIDSTAAVVVFVLLLLFLVFLDMMFDSLDRFAQRIDAWSLLEKLKKELMIMGILSFVLFIYETTMGGAQSDPQWLGAFEMSHIILLFIAFAFTIQALYLLNYAFKQGKSYLQAKRLPAQELSDTIHLLADRSPFEHWCFHQLPFWAPVDYPPVRKKVEVKLIERLFLSIHGLDEDFRFSMYISKLFRLYIGKLGEVSPRSWLVVIVLAVLNYARIVALDGQFNRVDCGRSIGSRRLDSAHVDGGPYCPGYFYRYSLLIAWTLSVLCVSTGILAKVYKARVVGHALALIGSPPVQWATDRTPYLLALAELAKLEALSEVAIAELRTKRARNFEAQTGTSLGAAAPSAPHAYHGHDHHGRGHDHDVDHSHESHHRRQSGHHDRDSDRDVRARDKIGVPIDVDESDASQLVQMKKKMRQRLLEQVKEEESRMQARWCPPIHDMLFPKSFAGKMNSIFLFDSPSTFFQLVELCLLLQSFYVAIWATQLIPLVVEKGGALDGWGVAFTVPMVLNYFVIRMILHDAVILQAVCEVHSQALAETKEEERLEATIVADIAKQVNRKYAEYKQACVEDGEEAEPRHVFFDNEFLKYDVDISGEISAAELVPFLASLDVHLLKTEERMLWQALDFDFSGELSSYEFYIALFPYEKDTLKDGVHVLVTCRRMLHERMMAEGRPLDARSFVAYVGELFDAHDAEASGILAVEELKLLITEIVGPDNTLTNVDMRNVFAALNFSESGVDRAEFLKLLTPLADQRVLLSKLPHSSKLPDQRGKRAEKRAVLQALSGSSKHKKETRPSFRPRVRSSLLPGQLEPPIHEVVRDPEACIESTWSFALREE